MPASQKRKIVFIDDDHASGGGKRRGKKSTKTAFSSIPTGSGELSFANTRDEHHGDSQAVTGQAPRQSVPSRPPPSSASTAHSTHEGGGDAALAPLLSNDDHAECGESYTDDEKKLNEFLKLHPMLSVNALSRKTLSHFSGLLDSTDVPVHDVQAVSKAYDDMFLRAANTLAGERSCVQGANCIGTMLARLRFGAETEKCVVLREYLLPDENDAFMTTGTLPVTRGKCLLCTRYYVSYMFRLLRADATMASDVPLPVVAFQNKVGVSTGDECCTHCNVVGSEEEDYPVSSLLAVDPSFVTTAASRGAMSCLLTRPVVAFNSSNYSYVQTPQGGYEIVQHFHGRGGESTSTPVVPPRPS